MPELGTVMPKVRTPLPGDAFIETVLQYQRILRVRKALRRRQVVERPRSDIQPTPTAPVLPSSKTGDALQPRSPSWSVKDDEMLKHARALGLSWNQISSILLLGKTPNGCRKRYLVLMECHKSIFPQDDLKENYAQQYGTDSDSTRHGKEASVLAQTYMEFRRGMWSPLARSMGEEWEMIERKCMELGLENLFQASQPAQTQRDSWATRNKDSGKFIPDLEEGNTHIHSVQSKLDQPSGQVVGQTDPQFETRDTGRILPNIAPHITPPNLEKPKPPFSDPVESQNNPSNIEQTDCIEATPQLDSCANREQQALGLQQHFHERHDDATPPLEDFVTLIHHGPNRSASDHCRHVTLTPNTETPESQEIPTSSCSENENSDVREESSDDSGHIYIDDINVQKELILDRLMVGLYDMFASTSLSMRNGHGSSSSSNTPRQAAGSPGSTSKQPRKKRKLYGRGEDGEQNEEDDGSGKRRRTLKEPAKRDDNTEKRLACPYYKQSPRKHHSSRACLGPGWHTVHRIKEHLYRDHSTPLHCRRCFRTFETEAQLTEHSRIMDGCIMKDAKPMEGFDKDQEKKLKSRSSMFRAENEEQKWKIVYLILFPDTALSEMPSPYYSPDDSIVAEAAEKSSPKLRELDQFDAYMNRELPRKVRKALEAAMERLIGPIEETLKNELENIVRNCQEALTRSYLDTARSLASSPGRQAGPFPPAQPAFVTELEACNSTLGTVGAEELSQYFLPPDTMQEPWLKMMDSPNNNNDNTHQATLSDSAYYSQSENVQAPFWDDSWLEVGNASGDAMVDNMETTTSSDVLPPVGVQTNTRPTAKGKEKARMEMLDDMYDESHHL